MWRRHRTSPKTSYQPSRVVRLDEHGQERLEAALADVAGYLRDEFVPAGLMINPLLSAWDAAHEFDADVAVPLEELMTALIHRASVQRKEILEVLDEVRALAVSTALLAAAGAIPVP